MIGIIFEHPTWLAPLFSALEQRHVPYTPLNVSNFSYALQASALLPLYVNRLSASSYQRQNQQAVACALNYMAFLVDQGATVLNARQAHLEVNKVAQMLAFTQHGLPTPRTWVFNHPEQLHHLPEDFPLPLLIKPSQGGAGGLIQRFDSRQALYAGAAALTFPPDGLMLAQEYIKPAQGYITRVEVLDGQCLYALKVYPHDNFNLCPADACSVETEMPSQAQFFLHDHVDTAILTTISRFFTALQLDFGSVEFLISEADDVYFYDLNLNSNYRTTLPGVEDFDPWGAFADYLVRRLHTLTS